jgi:hypothetical protein
MDSSTGYAVLQEALDHVRGEYQPLDEGGQAGPTATASDPPTPLKVLGAALVALEFYAVKNPGYANSWCQRGAQGVFHNGGRKFDRLEHSTLTGEGPTPQRCDDLVDQAVYGVLQLAYHLHHRPAEFTRYLQRELPERYPA